MRRLFVFQDEFIRIERYYLSLIHGWLESFDMYVLIRYLIGLKVIMCAVRLPTILFHEIRRTKKNDYD
jgi:hypothetical protein